MIFRPLDSSQFHRAVELNSSEEGICFRSSVVLVPGTIIQIRRGENKEAGGLRPPVAGIEKSRLATAVWCDEMEVEGYSHTCGVRYFEFDVIS